MALHFGKRPGLVAYITVGDPGLEISRDIALACIDAGADVVELGVPFSDPLADGPVIQAASQRALSRGVTLSHVLRVAAEVRAARPKAGLLAFGYLNPAVRMGLGEFCVRARDSGLDGALLTDLTLEEADGYLEHARSVGLETVFLAAPTSTDDRLERIAAASRGFVYAVSRTGVTGARDQVSGDAESLVLRLKRFTALPIAVGFGISRAEQVKAVGRFADAAVVGSALVSAIAAAEPEDAARVAGEFVSQLLAGA